jgi:hypothetical protein
MTAPSLWRRTRNTLRRKRHKQIPTIDVNDDGFVFTFRKREDRMRWDEVTRIDAGMRDYLSFDALYVVMIAGKQEIEIDELDDGFRVFEQALFARWPEIRTAWNKLLASNPHEPQHLTLWRRDERA